MFMLYCQPVCIVFQQVHIDQHTVVAIMLALLPRELNHHTISPPQEQTPEIFSPALFNHKKIYHDSH